MLGSSKFIPILLLLSLDGFIKGDKEEEKEEEEEDDEEEEERGSWTISDFLSLKFFNSLSPDRNVCIAFDNCLKQIFNIWPRIISQFLNLYCGIRWWISISRDIAALLTVSSGQETAIRHNTAILDNCPKIVERRE